MDVVSRRVLAIDPGTEQSAFLFLDEGRVSAFGIDPNEEVLWMLRNRSNHGNVAGADVVVIEKVESYGMAVGREVFDTVHWAGRFTEAAHGTPVHQLLRRAVKVAICHDTKAKDANIRAALIDRFGGTPAIRKGGPLYGISKDVWSALAIAVSYADGAR